MNDIHAKVVRDIEDVARHQMARVFQSGDFHILEATLNEAYTQLADVQQMGPGARKARIIQYAK
jgi:hypothetical protein